MNPFSLRVFVLLTNFLSLGLALALTPFVPFGCGTKCLAKCSPIIPQKTMRKYENEDVRCLFKFMPIIKCFNGISRSFVGRTARTNFFYMMFSLFYENVLFSSMWEWVCFLCHCCCGCYVYGRHGIEKLLHVFSCWTHRIWGGTQTHTYSRYAVNRFVRHSFIRCRENSFYIKIESNVKMSERLIDFHIMHDRKCARQIHYAATADVVIAVVVADLLLLLRFTHD